MTKSYIELLEEDFARQIEFNNIKIYHEQGYKGKGITILNAESYNDHGIMTTDKVLKTYAPDATVINSWISGRTSGDKVLYTTIEVGGEIIDLEEAIDKYNIKIITLSKSGSASQARLKYLRELRDRKEIILINSAGNEGNDIGLWAKDDTAIVVSACKLYANVEIKISYFGSPGEVDFTNFMAKGTGTSASAPATAAQVALLLQKYGDFTHVECKEILKSISMKLPGIEDYKQGWGLPILPLTDKLDILERLRGENMDFKDVEKDRWSKPAIDYLVSRGELKGFEDGTFRPSEPMTREQYAQARYNQLKLEGKI